jgi:outer membrane protein assembly factor BamB
MKKCFRFFCLLLTIPLSACNILYGVGSSNAPPPAPLVNFQPQLTTQNLWSTRVGYGIDKDYLKLGPIVDNKIFVADADGRVAAIDTQSGDKSWQTNTKTSITSGPTVGNGLVVVGTVDAQIIALNENTGQQVWRVKLPNALLAAPQISQDRVLVRTVDGKLCSLAVQDGHILWMYDHGSPDLILRVNSVPQVMGNVVVAGFADGKLAAFSLSQGGLLWEQTIAYPQGVGQAQQMVDVAADPVIAGGVIFVATYQGKVAAVSLQSGQILWQKDISTYTGLALGSQLLYVTDAQGTVWAFDRRTGNVAWHQTLLTNRMLTAPVLMGNAVVVADGEGYLHWLSQQDGHFVGRTLVAKEQKIVAPPAVLGNIIYTVTKDGRLFAVRVS